MIVLKKFLNLGEHIWNGRQSQRFASTEPPLRAELFSADQMEEHGKTLAEIHKLSLGLTPDQLLEQLAQNEAVLTDTCNLLTTAIKANHRIIPAGEWLLDNFYLIQEQIRMAKKHLPKNYSRELPRLATGPSAGFPRVYDIALEIISHGDGRVDPENLNRFVASYQTVIELKLGELWAIPIMLRLALIENLKRVAVRIAAQMIERDLANTWADRMMQVAATDPKSLILVIADMARSNPPIVSSFVSELVRRLQGQSAALAFGLTWIEQRLLEANLTIEQLVQSEAQVQAADQVSISNSIGSLRFLGAMDWRQFVETQSVVEHILLEDPQSIYAQMDFSTRNQYRHVVETLSKKTRLSEGEIAREAIQLTLTSAASKGNTNRAAHVGFYLIDDGLGELKIVVGFKSSIIDSIRQIGQQYRLFFYLGPITLITLILGTALMTRVYNSGLPNWMLGLVAIVSVLSISQLAIALVNCLATMLVPAQALPKMDFSAGIPAQASTLVAVPTMLMSAQNVEHLVEGLEVRFLANRDEHVYFALLTDFMDANTETTPEDEVIIQLAQSKIEALNEKYKNGTNDIFFLFHRPRQWNQQEGVWMGYERKRGKLADLNRLLREGKKDYFSVMVGNPDALSTVKYVITLDTDTQLPRDAARQFVGTMEHPLNRVHYDEQKRLAAKGHGILQPRIGVSLPGTNRSRYAALYGNEPGIDPYTRTVSDVYQDVFDEGSFFGKGIYDVDAFTHILTRRFPENRILSHDLLEGCYVRSGLLSDVQLYEEYPPNYLADVSRRRRWIRGDWQLIPWLMPYVPGFDNQSERNPISILSRWKILDNLRRSLVPLSLTCMFVLGWSILSPAWLWTLSAIAIILVPPLIFSILEAFRKPDDVLLRQHIAATMTSAARQLSQSLFVLACLPYEAIYSLTAIFQTIVRMTFTHRKLLAWNPSASLHLVERTDLLGMCFEMFSAPLLATLGAFYLFLYKQNVLSIACPILFLWFVSPVLAWWISLPLSRRKSRLTHDQSLFLHKMARKTWAFFETFVSAEEHWLPPDNFQEHPVTGVAHRTSPTNIGLSLLANLCAYDFGYIQAGELIERTKRTLATMQMLDRHRGHLYNWYDTRSLRPLIPLYISTVDSGNLAGHLLTLNSGLLALAEQKIVTSQIFEGLQQTLDILIDTLGKRTMPELTRLALDLKTFQSSSPTTLMAMHTCLNQLTKGVKDLGDRLADATSHDAIWWAEALKHQCTAALAELTLLTPWVSLSTLPAAVKGIPATNLIPTLRELANLYDNLLPLIEKSRSIESVESKNLDTLLELLRDGSQHAQARITSIEQLVLQSAELTNAEYEFLFDKGRHLLAIGYHVDDRRPDTGYYDLLASEARLCSFVAIAQDQIPQENWFALGRLLTTVGGEPVLFSWSGSMFEYLMPLLVMPTYANTLLDQTYKAAVKRQIEYGKQRSVPWGMSESGYNVIDIHLNYQYRAFGVPGLGLKRGLGDDLVVAPYASALALMVAPEEACLNLQRLASAGLLGKYGFYEAVDYTPSHLPRGQTFAIVESFMAHHQGMALLSLGYALLNQPMQKRFESDPAFQATALLLQERIPKTTAFHWQIAELSDLRTSSHGGVTPVRFFSKPDTVVPEVQLLSNGRYHVMMTNAGGGYSRWKDLAITRWREDGTCDNWGSFCYIRDLTTGEFWSTAYQPTLKQPDTYEAIFSEARVEFRRRDHEFDTHAEIVVSSEDDIELRRVRITNHSRTRKVIDVTSYAEVVLATPINDALHPAFSDLFVQTEIIEEEQAILCHRRPRAKDEQIPWMFHLMAIHGAQAREISYETDRMRFTGRGNSLINPDAMNNQINLSGSNGSVLDPIVAIRCRITLEPGHSATINIVTGVAENREGCLGFVGKYQDRGLADRVFDLAWTHSQVVLRQLNATESDGQLYASLANSIIYANASLRADPSILIKNRRGQSNLWGYAISGDLPIILLQIKDLDNIDLVRQVVQAHAYWRLKGLAVDLVIWNEDRGGYRQLIQDQILGLISAGMEANLMDKPGGIFVRAAEQIPSEDRILLQSVARAIISDSRGTLEEQISRRILGDIRVPFLTPSRAHQRDTIVGMEFGRSDLILFNGLGGFTSDGREYVITTAPEHVTPAPWVNVLANPYFGTVISENGLAYTWLENAHEFRLTPWYNDPVTDAAGEAFYIRDEESGYYSSPCPLPVRGDTPYLSRHGFGYSVFEHTENGITSELWIYVAIDAPVKFAALKVRNHSGRPRRLSATAYVEWVLGDLRSKTAMHVVTEIEAKTGALFARNPYNGDFADRVAFLDVDDTTRTLTGDRAEFLGRNGNLSRPAALLRSRLSGKVGAGLDPCAAIQVPFELLDGQEREIIFRLGIGQDINDAINLVNRFRGSMARRDAFENLCQYWKHTLGAVHIETPEPSLNVLVNGWLLYQTIACRLWARSGYYQSGGAFGFRDQLQDTMAIVHAEPLLLRKHLLLCASRQFIEGDVQHWWHPPSGRGVRTHCSDDYLWLPMATCRYVMMTGDTGVLDEQIHFLIGPSVNPPDDSYYDLPGRADESASLYEHCKRALLNGFKFGQHGLPLMGSGDWNDGMNLVGAQGKGESVWLGFFLYEVLRRFTKVAGLKGDTLFAERCEIEAAQIRENIDKNCWDGEWYLRAYFDDGSPLGSHSNPECQIDSISQSWSVLSRAGDEERSHIAMDILDKRLVNRYYNLIRLLDPPFDKSDLNPGYIKGYVPGVRENGGQYTHGAIWATMAFAALGNYRRAWELLRMINPVHHADSQEKTAIYKVEPYVMAADVYASPPHSGRGGWTWYTGSAGWMYRLIVEALLGIRFKVDKLRFSPCLSDEWREFKVHYRYRETVYHITVTQSNEHTGEQIVIVDGVVQQDKAISLVDDRREHFAEVKCPLFHCITDE